MSVTSLFPTQGLQNFVDESANLLVATTTAGTPAAGTFYSSIIGRAAIPDLTQDLKPRMGVDRVMTQQIFQIYNEAGPANEPVFGVVGDNNGLIRFVGGGWASPSDSLGPRAENGSATANGSYVEVTFYGTGLNMLFGSGVGGGDIRASVDGGAEGANLIAPTYSTVLQSKNYPINMVLPVVSGLTLGLHTAKLRANTTGFGMEFNGFEFLNPTGSVVTNPGSAFVGGKKVTLAAQSSIAYTNVVTGTRGGRVLQYLNLDGTVGQSFNAANATTQFLTATDHSNEEMVRAYAVREFGAGGVVADFSTSSSGSGNRAFTLDDGTTNLLTNGVDHNNNGYGDAAIPNATGAYITFTFVGTGLDIVNFRGAATSSTYSVLVDGVTVGSGLTSALSGTGLRNVIRIASGLPYGTHTFKLLCTNLSGAGLGIGQFNVYQPKKPALPAGAIELADFNVLATFVANTTAGLETISTGVLRKHNSREMAYTGTQSSGLSVGNTVGGIYVDNSATGSSQSFTFVGTGFDMRHLGLTDGATVMTFTLNGTAMTAANFPTATFSTYGVGAFTSSTGVLNQNGTLTPGSGLVVSGLPLGLYTVKVVQTTGTNMRVNTFDIITPIHSAKSNGPIDFQNTLTIGSQGISDNRKVSPIKDAGGTAKSSAIVTGILSGPTVSSTFYVPVPDMTATIKVGQNAKLDISSTINISGSGTALYLNLGIFVDGNLVTSGFDEQYIPPSTDFTSTLSMLVPVSPGVHTVSLMWRTNTSTASSRGTGRTLIVKEV